MRIRTNRVGEKKTANARTKITEAPSCTTETPSSRTRDKRSRPTHLSLFKISTNQNETGFLFFPGSLFVVLLSFVVYVTTKSTKAVPSNLLPLGNSKPFTPLTPRDEKIDNRLLITV
mmetsp:Transcript_19293/g.53809  ORF Transcript_19293/g.53809 Transcript_19293/m.53809 type:complete len:117 (-) Transcript_19293:2017-2367(-)